MHVHRQSCRGRSPRQPALLLAYLAQSQTQTAELPWYRSEEVLRCPQLLQILKEEPVLPIVCCGPLRTVIYHAVRQDEFGHLPSPFFRGDQRSLLALSPSAVQHVSPQSLSLALIASHFGCQRHPRLPCFAVYVRSGLEKACVIQRARRDVDPIGVIAMHHDR